MDSVVCCCVIHLQLALSLPHLDGRPSCREHDGMWVAHADSSDAVLNAHNLQRRCHDTAALGGLKGSGDGGAVQYGCAHVNADLPVSKQLGLDEAYARVGDES